MSNVVFMVNIKNESVPTRVVPYEYSINSRRKWCDKNDCQLFVLDEYIFEPDYLRPNWYKLYVFDLLEIILKFKSISPFKGMIFK